MTRFTCLVWIRFCQKKIAENCREFIRKLVVGGQITFHRCTAVLNHCGNWILLAFFDGSDLAYSCVLYAAWKLEAGGHDVRLLTSKARVAPDWIKNTVRIELDAGVLVSRVAVRVVRAVEHKPSKVIIAGDSETVLVARERSGSYFKEYFSNRIGETFDNVKKMSEVCPVGTQGEWYHVASKDNPADKPTRMNTELDDLKIGSEWQCGPLYLREPEENWPFERNFSTRRSEIAVPVEEIAKKYRNLIPKDRNSVILLELDNIHNLVKDQENGVSYDKAEVRTVTILQQIMKIAGPEDRKNYVVEFFKYGFCTNSWERLLKATGMLFSLAQHCEEARAENRKRFSSYILVACCNATYEESPKREEINKIDTLGKGWFAYGYRKS